MNKNTGERIVNKQIIVMGGGGFTMEPENPLLDEFVLNNSSCENPLISFLPTASNDYDEYIRWFYNFFSTRRCKPSHLALSNPHTDDFESYLLAQDIIYVGGGNTSRMLTLWKRYGLDEILRKAWENGILLAGVSAGAACWFEQALTDSIPGILSPEKCLGFLKGSFCAHFENPGRRPTFHRLIRTRELQNGIGVENYVGLLFEDQQIKKAVCSRPYFNAAVVRKEGNRTSENNLKIHFLGTKIR